MDTDTNRTSRVKFDRIEAGVFGNARKKLTGIADLAADIREHGLLQPMVVWHKKLGGGSPFELNGQKVYDRYILIAGNRRHAAIEKIREDDKHAFDELGISLFHGTELDAKCAQLAENLAREDLSPVEVMEAVHALSQIEGMTQTEIAKRLARTQGWVSRLLKVKENCVDEVHHALDTGVLSMDAAYDIASLDQEKQLEAMIEHAHAAKTNGKGAARKATRKAAGKSVRPGVKEIKERFAKYEESDAKMAPIVRKVLAWVLGEGDWL